MNPLVSIVCITYNQEQYIRETLDGFLIQKASFPIEIIIHDDASTDKTPQILKEYAKKDSRIKLILQKENQYSKGIRIWSNHCFPIAKGKYIALCEGDDYWENPLKLQKQIDFLEGNAEFNICAHTVRVYNETTHEYLEDNTAKWIGVNEIEDIALKCMLHTNTIVFRNNFVLPKWYDEAPVGDWPLFMIATRNGKIMKLDEAMSIYRIHNKGVWSGKLKSDRIKSDLKILKLFINNGNLNLKVLSKVKRKYRKYKFKLFKAKVREFFKSRN